MKSSSEKEAVAESNPTGQMERFQPYPKPQSRLEVYDMLRGMHRILKEVDEYVEDCDEWEKNALDAVDGVLYLAEGVFAHTDLILENEALGRALNACEKAVGDLAEAVAGHCDHYGIDGSKWYRAVKKARKAIAHTRKARSVGAGGEPESATGVAS